MTILGASAGSVATGGVSGAGGAGGRASAGCCGGCICASGTDAVGGVARAVAGTAAGAEAGAAIDADGAEDAAGTAGDTATGCAPAAPDKIAKPSSKSGNFIASLEQRARPEFVTDWLIRRHEARLQTGSSRAGMLGNRVRLEASMPTQPSQQQQQDDAPRSDDGVPPVPDEAGPHDVPNDQVIEQTLPRKRDGSDAPR